MLRPSLKDQRSHEILDAFVTCVARFGLEGATQERIAQEAGVKRTLLRHYLGNRDEMIEALTAHVVSEFEELGQTLHDATCDSPDMVSMLIDLLFDTGYDVDPRLTLVFQSLIVSVEAYPQMREPLLASMERFISLIGVVLGHSFPEHPESEIEAVVHGLSNTYLSCDAISPLVPPAHWRWLTL